MPAQTLQSTLQNIGLFTLAWPARAKTPSSKDDRGCALAPPSNHAPRLQK
ncbi:predicted protein [Plenodomus lingam JN3]|uniref:Predicted protein n=1 Tax=Leptosphaeria maculans (strain JN3 / isolate v23.1.3 / race Av1-4-5-6-7-8) TaxID=985895 RepID=E4ZSD2_LEPMJ|nr:predicted protein [Plenodomus lingam JN3]CBX94312.1 predicted protein [Plenodomus lingam JN3]